MKRLLAALLCLCLLFGFSACGAEETASKKPSSLPSSTSPASKPAGGSSEPDSSVAGPTSSHSSSKPDKKPTPTPPEETPTPEPLRNMAFEQLDEVQQAYYEKLYDGVMGLQTSWIILGPAEEDYKSDISVVRNALVADHPEIFWLPSYYATAVATANDGSQTAIIYFATLPDGDPSYAVKKSEVSHMTKELEAAIKSITDKVTATDPYEIELQLHDLLCGLVEYSDNTEDPMIYTAYGALVNKKALCEGYSKAMKLLLAEFGIQSITVTGMAGGESHMWNSVLLGGSWYNLDVTWDDTKGGKISHEYFNTTDDAIRYDHEFFPDFTEFLPEDLEDGTVSFNLGRPLCTGTEFNYYNRSGHVYFRDKADALAAYIIRTGGDFFEVRFSDLGFRDFFDQNTDEQVALINEALKEKDPEFKGRVNAVSISGFVLGLYVSEEEQEETVSETENGEAVMT